jgi:Transposase DDE domain group 1
VVERTTKRSADCPPACDWIIRFYNQRGTAEQHIKEGKQAINWTRLSCKGMAQNEVRLQLHALAYNLGVFLQGAELPEEIADWSLTSLQTRLDLSRFCAAPGARLGHFPFEGDGAFPTQC